MSWRTLRWRTLRQLGRIAGVGFGAVRAVEAAAVGDRASAGDAAFWLAVSAITLAVEP